MKTFNTILNESSLARVHSHTQGRNIGIITAHRDGYTAKENKERNTNLKNDLKKTGLGHVRIKGRYIENYGSDKAVPRDEHSYLVVGHKGDDSGHLLGHLKKLGKKYDQDSVLHKAHNEKDAHLHGTKDGVFPGLDKKHSVGEFHPNRAGEFHSVMRKGNKAFSFEEGFVCEELQFVNDVTFFGREESEF